MTKSKNGAFKDKFFALIFTLATATAVISVGLISLFVFASAIPTISKIGFNDFIFGQSWRPSKGEFGILPMIAGSLYVTLGAGLIGVPLGILAAVFMAYYCPPRIKSVIQAGINLLAGIPSVVYGLWALEVIVPIIAKMSDGFGLSILAAMILLGIMILPTVISLSQSAIESVPQVFYQGAIGLGADKERAIFTVVLPAASSGIMSAVIMGIGRAIGETMAVQMVIGNQPAMPSSLFFGARTLTTNVTTEMAYAGGLHREALIATGAILFVFILLLNLLFNLVKNREGNK